MMTKMSVIVVQIDIIVDHEVAGGNFTQVKFDTILLFQLAHDCKVLG